MKKAEEEKQHDGADEEEQVCLPGAPAHRKATAGSGKKKADAEKLRQEMIDMVLGDKEAFVLPDGHIWEAKFDKLPGACILKLAGSSSSVSFSLSLTQSQRLTKSDDVCAIGNSPWEKFRACTAAERTKNKAKDKALSDAKRDAKRAKTQLNMSEKRAGNLNKGIDSTR